MDSTTQFSISNRKDAVIIGVTLSTQLISASLAMIAIVATFTAFVIDKREVGAGYYALAMGAFLSFILSIVYGGKGIDKARKDGIQEKWNIENTKSLFNRQAQFALLGIILFTLSAFLGTEKADATQKKIEEQQKVIYQLQLADSLNKVQIQKISTQLDELSKKVSLKDQCSKSDDD